MDKSKTGIFYIKRKNKSGDPTGETDVVIVDEGIEIARYQDVKAFVAKHREGLYAIGRLEENMERAIESQYTPYPPAPDN